VEQCWFVGRVVHTMTYKRARVGLEITIRLVQRSRVMRGVQRSSWSQ
jgi:hypothetical protein